MGVVDSGQQLGKESKVSVSRLDMTPEEVAVWREYSYSPKALIRELLRLREENENEC